jgi:hypothetical protein
VAFIRAVMLPGRGSSCADASTTLTAATAAGERTARRFSGLPTRRREARGLLDVWPSGPRTVPAPDPAGSPARQPRWGAKAALSNPEIVVLGSLLYLCASVGTCSEIAAQGIETGFDGFKGG